MLVVGCAIMGILLFLLATASDNSDFFDEHYPWLLGLNVLVALSLLALVCVMLVRLYRRYRRGKFGSRLMARLVMLFAGIGILPGIVIYVVSVQFVSRSIESWFDVRVESALHSGVKLGQVVLDSALNELNAKAHRMAKELADLTSAEQVVRLSSLREQNLLQEAVIVTSNGQLLANASAKPLRFMPDLPTQAMLLQARVTSGFSAVEGGTDPDGTGPKVAPPLRLRVVVAIPIGSAAMSVHGESTFLQLLQPLPKNLAANAESLSEAYSEYKTRSLSRTGLRKMYLVTLSLTLLLAIFGATASAFMIANNLARPLLHLAQGTKAVAEGDFSPRPIIASPDELGLLTQSFNTMTMQLSDARTSSEKNRAELENAKIYLESVLGNMSAGVMVLDADFQLVSCNESVERILQHEMQSQIGKSLADIEGLAPFATAIAKAFSEQSAQSAAGDGKRDSHYWQQQIEIPRAADDPEEADHVITLLARGSTLPVKNGVGSIVVFDDISDVISAQRSIAWGEVARRLAHEIKNPLTPIQLAAERIQMKLEEKLDPQERALLKKGTATIVNQVESMKRMVDDFRDYARMPPPDLHLLDLNRLIEEVIHLYTGGEQDEAISVKLASNLPKVMGDATQLRQIIHNLLQNAQDAVRDRSADAPGPKIDVVTEVISYQDADGKDCEAVRFSVADNGPGFAQRILTRAFEPYVTTKSRGTGLGLAMVKKIIDEHSGRIDIQNRADGPGAKVSILLLKLAQN
jgi:nitrogen fixation/metabolism regulation signal transduction histidine kinase